MCGRYYVDDDTVREIEKMVQDLDRKMMNQRIGDIYPSEKAVVLNEKEHKLAAQWMQWGFPGYDKKQLLINARAEGILEKRTFRDSVLHHRCVIPAKGFYEWNSRKEKYKFQRLEENMLYMAGCFKQFQEQNRFVVITTQANSSVLPVHHRMPLILEKKEIEDWVMDNDAVEFLLHKTPVMLGRYTDYEQMRFFL